MVYSHVCTYIYMPVYICVHVYMRTYLRTYIYIYIYVHMDLYTICIYTIILQTHIWNSQDLVIPKIEMMLVLMLVLMLVVSRTRPTKGLQMKTRGDSQKNNWYILGLGHKHVYTARSSHPPTYLFMGEPGNCDLLSIATIHFFTGLHI